MISNIILAIIMLHIAASRTEDVTGNNGDIASDPVGHMLPLGAHRPPEGSIEELNSFPHPADFYHKYIYGSKPVLFKGAAKDIPAFSLWTDEYLKNTYGHTAVSCELGKKENRSQQMIEITMDEFLQVYNTKDIYMVEDLSQEMKDDLSMPRSLQCGGFQDGIMSVIMWFSSGGTKSVLHHDDLDNINCLFDGQKELIMFDKSHEADVEADYWEKSRGFSRMDVDHVDLYKFPAMRDVPWYNAHMDTGDCLFIPVNWYHAVDSSKTRNMAVNLWFTHRLWFDQDDCDNLERPLTELHPLNHYQVATETAEREELRSALFQSYQHLDKITIDDMRSEWEFEEEDLLMLFELTDQNKDGQLTWEEVNKADLLDILRELVARYETEQGEQEDHDEL